ncbi:DUF4153 domain-containing protein [Tepidibacter sp. Z1-5]|uniref:DUF4153 domain-containing protein n=1 Tax=Tepidibacter sp. Z1-5 TaxID=3134138 RepID=UPI0030BF47AB
MIVNCVNIDKMIVNKNIKRYNETGRLDKQYIRSLSYDAIDVINQNKYKLDTKLVEEYIKEEKEYLQESYDHWYEYNYYRCKFLNTNL